MEFFSVKSIHCRDHIYSALDSMPVDEHDRMDSFRYHVPLIPQAAARANSEHPNSNRRRNPMPKNH